MAMGGRGSAPWMGRKAPLSVPCRGVRTLPHHRGSGVSADCAGGCLGPCHPLQTPVGSARWAGRAGGGRGGGRPARPSPPARLRAAAAAGRCPHRNLMLPDRPPSACSPSSISNARLTFGPQRRRAPGGGCPPSGVPEPAWRGASAVPLPRLGPRTRLSSPPCLPACRSPALLFIAQLRCRRLQEGAPDFSPSAHPCSPLLSPLGCTSLLCSLLLSPCGGSSCSLMRSRGPPRRARVPGRACVALALPAPALLAL